MTSDTASKGLLLLGSTGSIGTQTLDCVREARGAIAVRGIAAQRSGEAVLQQAREFRPSFVALHDQDEAERIRPQLPDGCELLSGPDAAATLARDTDYDLCVNGVVGAAGLIPSARVLERGKTLALANKESLVIAGKLLMAMAKEHGATLLPVDSEHCAIFQCLAGGRIEDVRRVILTASGGPFRTASAESLASMTPAQALKHPNWDMGPRISVGSATLMNKALEVIELHHLWGLERERIHVVCHPQSIVHSMVEYVDGSVIAQMGPPDMRGPIHYCLHWPDRAPAALQGFDLDLFSQLTFEAPDLERFPALGLGFRCVEEGSDAGCVLNAADEVAVAAFLEGQIPFPGIATICSDVLNRRPGLDDSLDSLLAADARARDLAGEAVAALSAP